MNAPWNPNKRSGGLAPRDVFAAFVCDGAFGDLVAAAAAELGWAADKVHGGGLDHAVQTLSVTTGPQVLLVDLSDCADPLNDINALADVCEPGTVVIAAGPQPHDRYQGTRRCPDPQAWPRSRCLVDADHG